jgi:hypothetical protein
MEEEQKDDRRDVEYLESQSICTTRTKYEWNEELEL